MSSEEKIFNPQFDPHLLHPKYWLSWLALFGLAFFALLPAFIRDPIAKLVARLLLKLVKKPLKVIRANLAACFTEKSEQERELLLKQNVETFIMTLLGQAELIIFGRERLKQRVNLIGFEHVEAVRAQGKPIVFIIPHVWGVEYAGLRLNLELTMVSMVKAHRNPLFSWFNNKMRSSLGATVYLRQAGLRALIKELKQDVSFFYLPDEDLGADKSIFAPFFNQQKATLPVVGRLAQTGNAMLMPVQIGYNQQTRRYDLTVLPAIDPSNIESKAQEAIVLNQIVEQAIRAYPEQYMWFLKILKTRPEGESSIYQ